MARGKKRPHSPPPSLHQGLTHLYGLAHPCLPQDMHSPRASLHPLGLWAPQPTYKQTPEGHCQQPACQWPSNWPKALVYGPWGHPRWRLLSTHRTGHPLEGALRGPARTVGAQGSSDPGATSHSPISDSTGTHSCGAKHPNHRGHAVLSGLAEGHWAREKLWHVAEEDCNEAQGRRTH